MTPEAATDAGEASTKACPDCAETVLAAANVCRYCGHRFGPTPTTTPTTEGRSPALAALLGLIIPGTGHLYLGDQARAVPFGIAWVIAFVAASQGLPGAVLLTGIIAAIDAFRGARDHNQTGTLAGATGGAWWLPVIIGALVALGLWNQDRMHRNDPVGPSTRMPTQAEYESCMRNGGDPVTCNAPIAVP